MFSWAKIGEGVLLDVACCKRDDPCRLPTFPKIPSRYIKSFELEMGSNDPAHSRAFRGRFDLPVHFDQVRFPRTVPAT